jgi:transposase
MNKIDKLDKELEKAREKAAEWQAKIRELEKQKQEEENSQIVQAVRSLKLPPGLFSRIFLMRSRLFRRFPSALQASEQ